MTTEETNSTNQSTTEQSTADQSTTDQSAAGSQPQSDAGKELIDELTRVGQKFVEVVEVAWNSEQRKKIEEDLRTGLVSVATTLEDGFKRVSSSKEAQEAVNAAEEVATKVRSSKITQELSEALAEGLRALSEQMDKLSSEIKQKNAASSTNASSAQETKDIPIDRSTDRTE